MSEEIKRIFVGGISSSVTEEELVSKFKKFGEVKSVQLKTKRDALGGPPNTFAFINISLTSDSLYKCFTTLGNTKWKGSYLRLEVAKENFLDRLKKEREQQHSSGRESFESRKKPSPTEQRNASRNFSSESRTISDKTIENRRPVIDEENPGNIPTFEGFSFSGKGEFDYLFETAEENDAPILPGSKRKVSTSEDFEPENKYQRSDDLMDRMESFSNMWKDDFVSQLPEASDAEEKKLTRDREDAEYTNEDQQTTFQTSVTTYLRFDPTRKDHQKYILSPSKKEKKRSREIFVEGEEDEDDQLQSDSAPKDKFYKVAEDLKSRFEGKKNKNTEGSFSLLAALGSQPQTQENEEDAGQQFEESWESWGAQETSYNDYDEYRDYSTKTSLLIVAGDPRLQEGVAFISEKPDRKAMLAKWKEQKPMLKILWKKKHKDALREDKGVKSLRGTNRGFPGRGRKRGKR